MEEATILPIKSRIQGVATDPCRLITNTVFKLYRKKECLIIIMYQSISYLGLKGTNKKLKSNQDARTMWKRLKNSIKEIKYEVHVTIKPCWMDSTNGSEAFIKVSP